MKPEITIVIPVYNRAEIVKRTLGSVLAQTYRPFKMILVDNNSADSTFDVISKWKEENESEQLQIFVLKENTPGACAARNKGLSATDTKWIMFFDSDDTMPSDHLELAMEYAKKNEDADIIGWSRIIRFLDGKSVRKEFSVKNMEFMNLTQSIFATQNYLARTSLIRKAGGWDEKVVMGDDIELGSRLLLLNPKVVRIPGHYVTVHDSAVSITNSTTNRIATYKYTLEKLRGRLPDEKKHWVDLQLIIKAASWAKNDPEQKKVVKEILKNTPPLRRLLWNLLYRYQLAGGRGVARFYSLLHFKNMKV